MSKFLITVEVDTDRDLYGSAWGANYGGAKHTDEDILKGDLITTNWDHPPFMQVVSITRPESVSTAPLSDAARAVIAGCVADSEDIEAEPVAPRAVWDEVRAAFPLALYAAVWSSEVGADYVAER